MKKLPTLESIKDKYKPAQLQNLSDEEILEIFKDIESVWDYDMSEREQKGLGLARDTKVSYFKQIGYRLNSINHKLYRLADMREEGEVISKILDKNIYFQKLNKETQDEIRELEEMIEY